MKKTKWYTLNLQLFGGEADGAVGETGDNIADAGQNGADDTGAEFDELINGKFKEQFTRKTQAIIDKRFKQTKQLEEYKSRVSPIVDVLMERYNVSPGDESRLTEYVRKEKAESQNDNLHKSTYGFKDKIGGWINESKELREAIPDFDLRKELKGDKTFSRLLMSGMSVKGAYETVHRDEILADAVSITADRVRKQVVEGIQAKGMRPVENGISSETAIMTAVDVNSLTSQDIIKILKQVENGANISF